MTGGASSCDAKSANGGGFSRPADPFLASDDCLRGKLFENTMSSSSRHTGRSFDSRRPLDFTTVVPASEELSESMRERVFDRVAGVPPFVVRCVVSRPFEPESWLSAGLWACLGSSASNK
ncbi:hypothetical protein DIPPA_12634 [Diplonema papillatum]|nr:hypothetical protein DIPPA_12634 [Diplonema papillatum]